MKGYKSPAPVPMFFTLSDKQPITLPASAFAVYPSLVSVTCEAVFSSVSVTWYESGSFVATPSAAVCTVTVCPTAKVGAAAAAAVVGEVDGPEAFGGAWPSAWGSGTRLLLAHAVAVIRMAAMGRTVRRTGPPECGSGGAAPLCQSRGRPRATVTRP